MEMNQVVTYVSSNLFPGSLVPKRIFVGGIPFGVTSTELKHFFSAFGSVTHCNIIRDDEGLSKGYCFVSFERRCDALNVLRMGTVFFREKRLKIKPAFRRSQEGEKLHYGSLEDFCVPSNRLSWNNAIYGEYPATVAYDSSMHFACPVTSALHIGFPHCIQYGNYPAHSSESGGFLMSQNPNECCCVANSSKFFTT